MSNTLVRVKHELQYPLDHIFTPKTVAVIGATERPGSIGRNTIWNMISNSFGGTVFPVNPNRHSVLGIKCYPNIKDVPAQIDLAVIVTPAAATPAIVRDCVEADVKGAVILSAGFKEGGEQGALLERQIMDYLNGSKMRLVGPNCLGVMCPPAKLNASAATAMALNGKVGFVSQSAAICNAVLDWSLSENVGFSHFISVGSMLDLGWGDIIDYLGNEPNTKSIVIYMETIDDARAFLSAAREVAIDKPIIVLKAGRTTAAAKAAVSHTGVMTGNDEVLDAAFRRAGILRVNSLAELFYMAEALSKQPIPKGPRLTIVTNTGGLGVIATDSLINDGGQLAPLSPEVLAAYEQVLPPNWSRNNPVDILGDAGPERYAKAIEISINNPDSDGLLVILAPQPLTKPLETAQQLQKFAADTGKTILASWVGGDKLAEADTLLAKSGIPTFDYPDTAVRVFNYMWRYGYNLRSLYETPILAQGSEEELAARHNAANIIQTVRDTGRAILTELESKQILSAYGIPTVETRLALTEAEAIERAGEIGYPVALKLNSRIVTHKSSVGGVRLDLYGPEEVGLAFRAIERGTKQQAGEEAFQGVTVQPMVKAEGCEIILGSSIDPQFGPVMLFGRGGRMVEEFHDRTLGLPPLNTTLARRMLENTRIGTILKEKAGEKQVNLAELEQVMVRFSQLVVEQNGIKEIDINPLFVCGNLLLALDARIILHEPGQNLEDLPRVAIRAYPIQYVEPWTLKDGTPMLIRPIRPEDEPLMVKFHETLSDRSVYFRYVHMINLSQRIAHERLTRICFLDYDREMALVGEYKDPNTGERQILGVGRLSKLNGTQDGEFAILVSDNWQGRGLGKELLRRITEVGRDEKLKKVIGFIHPENRDMQRVSKLLGYKVRYSMMDDLMKAEIEL